MSKKKRKKPGKAMRFKQDPMDARTLILRNGTRIRQSIEGVGLYISHGKRLYALTSRGLCPRSVDFTQKNNYCKRLNTGRGRAQGQVYPRVSLQGKKYRLHQLMALAWCGGIPDGFVADHINGDIDNFSFENIRVIDILENNRCGGILKRLRNLSKKRNDPSLDPLNIKQDDLLEIFERTKGVKGKKQDKVFLKEVERYRVLITLRHASAQLRDPNINPDNMSPERRNLVLSKYFIDDSTRVIRRNIIRKN